MLFNNFCWNDRGLLKKDSVAAAMHASSLPRSGPAATKRDTYKLGDCGEAGNPPVEVSREFMFSFGGDGRKEVSLL